MPLSSYFCPSGRKLPHGIGPCGSKDKFNYLSLLFVAAGYDPIKENLNLRKNAFLIFAPALVLSNFRFFSSVNNHRATVKEGGISLSCISKLGIKLYENPVTHKSRVL